MSKYLALLGNTPQLSFAELQAVMPDQQLKRISKHSALFSLEDEQHLSELQSILGGVFKILRLEQTLPEDKEQVLDQVVLWLVNNSQQTKNNDDDKITFSLSSLDQDILEISPSKVKSRLKEYGNSVRYREADQWGVSSAVLLHNSDLVELIIAEVDDVLYLAQTVTVQALESWVVRDRDKPYSSGRKGMLPPKLARIMVNLGLGRLDQPSPDSSLPLLYDPFCGTGTVLLEGLLRGCEVMGSDLDQDAVDGSLKNLEWFSQHMNQEYLYGVFKSDVAHVTQDLFSRQVDLIVTEPYLGKQNPKDQELKNIFTGLRSLYLGAFKNWTSLLSNDATVVIIFPQVITSRKTYDLLYLIDKIEGFGYTSLVEPIEYGYEKATVKRQILIFRFNGR